MVIDDVSMHFVLSTSDIFREGKPVGVVLVLHDISKRKALEEDLRRANRNMSNLNQILRHDMRNDLTAIWGYLELLEITELSDRQKHLVGKMMERTRSADGHLEFAKVQGGAGMAATDWQDVQTIITRALSKVDMDGVHIDVRVQGVRLLADPLLENVFHTLADNTMRHGERASKVVVRAENTEAGISIIWEDDGVGIASDRKERIFDKGFGDNTGLGLYLAREILATTGITITEEGQPGNGARFVIRAPSGWFTGRSLRPHDQRQHSSPQTTSSFPLKAAMIMAAAHPTPLSTAIAPEGQLIWQAPHSMHRSARTIRTLPSPCANTRCGQTFRHMPQLMHRPGLKAKVLISPPFSGGCISSIPISITTTPRRGRW